ncbi:MAG TPA: hypothetical protein VG889_15350 [Rhizomicrobium sp.]|nr:hypothetical protein [Rhizomicrobium sp.]
MSDALHMPPIKAPKRFWLSMFGASAAPIFWIGQVILGYWVSAEACYGSDHPGAAMPAESLRALLTAFDAVAILAALAGGAVSILVFRATGSENEVEGRTRFLAIWGLLSSLWFLGAIVFNVIATLGVPLCTP